MFPEHDENDQLAFALRDIGDYGPRFGSLWVHIKTNTMIRVVGDCVIEKDCTPAVLYREVGDVAGVTWVRPLGEFLQGFVRRDKE